MSQQVPNVQFSNGKSIPVLGLGTWKSKPNEVYEAVKYAIMEAGYRHIDCAAAYQNEDEVGRAIKDCIASGKVNREDLFITSKCWNTFHSTDLVKKGLAKTLTDLQLDYLDLYLIHWPFGYQEGGELFPKGEDGKMICSDVDWMDTWKGMEAIHAEGLTKSIGVSNFNSEQIKRLLDNGKVKPVVNQVELHPYNIQAKLIEFCKANGIAVEAYSPLGSPDRPWAKAGDPLLMEDPKIVEIAQRLNKTPAHILTRYPIQRGLIVIPKSVNPARILANIQVFDFELSEADMKLLDSFDRGHRFCALEDMTGHPHFPFTAEF